ncbi:MAG: hypothetical protein COA83_00520 [Methylophaga sp.]|nr:MAG: hypothetical protein COA83_00520 [Methylophaga sp.]
MNTHKFKMQGSLSISTIIFILVVVVAGGAYAYIDNQADLRAEEVIISIVEDAKAQGVDISYDTIDTSPIARSITLQNFKISGAQQAPDVILGNVVISGLNWRSLQDAQDHIPLSMSIEITDGKILLDEEMIGDDQDLKSFVEVMGDELNFTLHANYNVDESTGILTASLVQQLDDNFSLKANLEFGNTGWLAYVKTGEPLDNLILDLLATTLNDLSIAFRNEGIIEKIRTVSAKQTGLSSQQLTEQAVQNIRQIQASLQNYNPVYSLMLEELIKFTEQPNQLLISIDPEQPLTSDDFLKVFMGGQSAPFDLMKKAQLFIRAN